MITKIKISDEKETSQEIKEGRGKRERGREREREGERFYVNGDIEIIREKERDWET